MHVALIFNIEYKNIEMDPPSDDENAPVRRSLVEKYQNTVSRGEKIRILTIFAESWSHRKILEKFGCPQRMATQAKHLAYWKRESCQSLTRKWVKTLPVEIREMVISFYKEDNISRPTPRKKDCFAIEKNGENLKVRTN